MSGSTTRGRPPASSREILQDSAFDLFLEKSYAHTSIDDITQRAGVSRATFFNYFPSKSDVFWVELDDALALFQQDLSRLAEITEERDPEAGLRLIGAALDRLATELSRHKVPFALTQHELVGSINELQASALSRLSEQAVGITSFLELFGHRRTYAQAAAYAIVASAISAVQDWASAGTTREPLQVYLGEGVNPVLEGFSTRQSMPTR